MQFLIGKKTMDVTPPINQRLFGTNPLYFYIFFIINYFLMVYIVLVVFVS